MLQDHWQTREFEISIPAMQTIQDESLKSFLSEVLACIRSTVNGAGSDLLVEMASYHFESVGKMLRPQVAFRLGQALGVEQNDLVLWAACCEMLHNATLVHDDLQDGDSHRRGHMTIWKKYGPAQAINLGDFLMLLAPQLILEMQTDSARKLELMKLYSKMSTRIVNGQSFEAILNQRFHIEMMEEGYFSCISQKTSELFAGTAAGVALLSGASPNNVDHVAQTFINLGNIFQVQDDILDLYGDKQREKVGCDIREGKLSYLVVRHLMNRPSDLSELKEILLKSRELTTDEDIQRVLELFKQGETLSQALDGMEKMLRQFDMDISCDSSVLNHIPVQKFVREFSQDILKPIQHLRAP